MDRKVKMWLTAALLAAAVMVPFVLQRGNLNRLRAENSRLEAQNADLGRQLARATNAVPSTNQQPGALSKDQLLELMRLRAEVTALRKYTNSLAGAVTSTSARTAAGSPPGNSPAETQAEAARPLLTTNSPPWQFKGFATPSDTLSTMVWAMEQGRMDVVLSSATSDAQAQIQQEYGSMEKLKAQASEIAEIKPSPNHPGNENEVFLNMVIHKPGQQVIAEETIQVGGQTIEKGQPYTIGPQVSETLVKLQRVGNEWKFAGKFGK